MFGIQSTLMKARRAIGWPAYHMKLRPRDLMQTSPTSYMTTASTLHLDHWPDSFETRLGDGHRLYLRETTTPNGDLLAREYVQPGTGITLRILNDLPRPAAPPSGS
jgi:hypothetical protein